MSDRFFYLSYLGSLFAVKCIEATKLIARAANSILDLIDKNLLNPHKFFKLFVYPKPKNKLTSKRK